MNKLAKAWKMLLWVKKSLGPVNSSPGSIFLLNIICCHFLWHICLDPSPPPPFFWPAILCNSKKVYFFCILWNHFVRTHVWKEGQDDERMNVIWKVLTIGWELRVWLVRLDQTNAGSSQVERWMNIWKGSHKKDGNEDYDRGEEVSHQKAHFLIFLIFFHCCLMKKNEKKLVQKCQNHVFEFLLLFHFSEFVHSFDELRVCVAFMWRESILWVFRPPNEGFKRHLWWFIKTYRHVPSKALLDVLL